MDLEELALKAYETIFGGESFLTLDVEKHMVDHTPQRRLRLLNLHGFTFLEQNLEKGSHWGKIA